MFRSCVRVHETQLISVNFVKVIDVNVRMRERARESSHPDAKFLERVLARKYMKAEGGIAADFLLGLRNIWTEISPRYRQDERTIRAGRMTGGMQIDSNSLLCLNPGGSSPPIRPSLFPRVPWRIRHPRVLLSRNPRMHRATLIILIYRRLRYYPPESKAGGSIPLIRIMGLICIHDASVTSKGRIATEVAL